MSKKILLTKKFFEKDLAYLKTNLNSSCQIIDPLSYDEDTLIKHAKDVNVLLGGFISEKLLNNCSELELIQIPWTGVDKLNFEALKNIKAAVCNSHSNSAAVAEFSVALFLSMVKNIPYHDRALRNGDWNRPSEENLNTENPFSPMVSSLTIGILGFGSIGKKIVEFLKPFQSKFITYNASTKLINEYEGIENHQTIEEFLKISDVVFVCLPLTDLTKNILNKETLKYLKKGSYFINTARGEVVDDNELYKLILSREIKGAAIDTWWKPPVRDSVSYPSDNEYHRLDNVIMSPHRAGMIENDLPHLKDAITNINNLCEDKPLINRINLEKKY